LLGRALQADAAYAPARVNLGLLDIGAGRLEAGIRHLEQAMPHVDDPVPLWQALARAYTATGQNEKARAAMRAARAKR
jgi:Tfp pilus assembly protein PilF